MSDRGDLDALAMEADRRAMEESRYFSDDYDDGYEEESSQQLHYTLSSAISGHASDWMRQESANPIYALEKDESLREKIRGFFTSYKTRYKDADVDPSLFTPYQDPSPKWDLKPLAQPELSYKDKKEKKGAMKAAAKRANVDSIAPHATQYTAYLAEQAEKKRELSNDSMGLYSRSSLVVTNAVHHYDDGSTKDEFTVKDLYKKDYDPRMFDPDYFAENFTTVMDDMAFLHDMIKYFDSPYTDPLEEYDKQRLEILRATYERMESCYDLALATHSLVKDQYGRLSISGDIDTEAARTRLAEAQQELTTYIFSQDNSTLSKIREKMVSDLQENFLSQLESTQKKFDDLRSSIDFDDDESPFIYDEPFFSDSTYDEIRRLYRGTKDPANTTRVNQNSTAIDGTMKQFLDESRGLSTLQQMDAAMKKMIDDLTARKGDPSNFDEEDRAYYDAVLRRKKENDHEIAVYTNHIGELTKALDLMIFGNVEATDVTHMILLEHEYQPDYNKQEAATRNSELFPDRIHRQNNLVEDLLHDKFAMGTVEDTVYHILEQEPLRFLLQDGQTEAEQDVILSLMLIINKDHILKDLEAAPEEKKTSFQSSYDAIIRRAHNIPRDDKITSMLEDYYFNDTVKKLLAPRLAQITGFDPVGDAATKAKFTDPTQESLIAMQPEFMEMAMTGAILTRLATAEAWRVKGGDKRSKRVGLSDDPDLVVKQQYAEAVFMQSRAAALLSRDASRYFNTLRDCLTDEEYNRMMANTEYDTEEEKYYAFARELLKKGKTLQAAAESRFTGASRSDEEMGGQ
ncbi:MAG: hypothetical protein K6B14_09770 [Lachnospiraceae bacterium]|nr:hypothetical protein [Lachnospiraceae bacterium]